MWMNARAFTEKSQITARQAIEDYWGEGTVVYVCRNDSVKTDRIVASCGRVSYEVGDYVQGDWQVVAIVDASSTEDELNMKGSGWTFK